MDGSETARSPRWRGVATAPHRRGDAGFSLLEIMVALVILAMAFSAIGGAYTASGLGIVRSYRSVIAADLLRSIILDVEEEYQVEGFPENDKEGVDCEVPKPYDQTFDCDYDIVSLETDADVLSELSNSGDISALASLDPTQIQAGNGAEALQQSGVDISRMAAVAALFGPEGPQVISTCRINLAAMLSSIMGMTAFFPVIVQKAAEQTRKLTVRLSWDMGPHKRRTVTVETFIIAIPREDLRKHDQLQKVLDSGIIPAIGGALNPSGGGTGGGSRSGGKK